MTYLPARELVKPSTNNFQVLHILHVYRSSLSAVQQQFKVHTLSKDIAIHPDLSGIQIHAPRLPPILLTYNKRSSYSCPCIFYFFPYFSPFLLLCILTYNKRCIFTIGHQFSFRIFLFMPMYFVTYIFFTFLPFFYLFTFSLSFTLYFSFLSVLLY